jgi:tetratricopeptide (TPR) repeat protein
MTKGTKSQKEPIRPSFSRKTTTQTGQKKGTSNGVSGKMPLLLALLVLVLTGIALAPLLKNGFTNWDDVIYVTKNPLLKSTAWDGLKAIFSTPVSSNYHPITILSLAINYQMSGLKPFSYLMTNLLFHLCNTLLVFYFIYRLSGKQTITALFVSLIFGIHPMHVESVAWVSERKDVLYVFFILVGFIGYLNYLKHPSVLKYLGIFVLFVLSLLSKPAAVVFPVLLLLIDYYRDNQTAVKRLILEKIPFFIASLVVGVATFKIQSVDAISMERFSFMQRLLFGMYGYVAYIIKLFVPVGLSAIHPFPENEALNYAFYLAPVAILAILFLMYLGRKNRALVFGLGFYTVSVFLVLQFISVGNAIIAERYTYLAYLGLLFVLGTYYNKVVNNTAYFPGGKNALHLLFVGMVLLLMANTYQRTKIWNNSEVLWTDVLEKYPNSYRAHMCLGSYYVENGKYELALTHLNRSLEINPMYENSLELRGVTYNYLKQYALALVDLEKCKGMDPNNSDLCVHISISLDALDRPTEALTYLNQAIELNPDNTKALSNRGALYFNKLKDYQRALIDFNSAIEVDANFGMAYFNRANCYLVLGDKVKAKENANKAIQLGIKVPKSLLDNL